MINDILKLLKNLKNINKQKKTYLDELNASNLKIDGLKRKNQIINKKYIAIKTNYEILCEEFKKQRD